MIPKFHSGQTLKADDLNALVAEIAAVRKIAESALLRDVSGATFSRDASGTTLSIPPPPRRGVDDEAVPTPQRHPFKVEVLEVAGERFIGVFEPITYVVKASTSVPIVYWPVGPVFGDAGERFATLELPPVGRNSLSLNISLTPALWSIEGGGRDGGFGEGYSPYGFALEWNINRGGISIHVADVTRSVDEAGGESFSFVQHLRSSPFIPDFLPDPSRLMVDSNRQPR